MKRFLKAAVLSTAVLAAGVAPWAAQAQAQASESFWPMARAI
jgi:hypothetical protein